MKFTYKKLNYLYTVLETYNAGIILEGWEPPNIRQSGIDINESYITFNKDNKLVLRNSYIQNKNIDFAIETPINRDRELLLTKKELVKIKKKLEQKGLTAVPASVYLKNNLFKVEIAICRGKKLYDKRESIKKKDFKKEIY